MIAKRQVGRPILLGEIDDIMQCYLVAANNRDDVISKAIAFSISKALMPCYPHLFGSVYSYLVDSIDINSSHWAQSFLAMMGFIQRRATTAKLEVPEGAVKEETLLFYHEIVSKVEKFQNPNH